MTCKIATFMDSADSPEC